MASHTVTLTALLSAVNLVGASRRNPGYSVDVKGDPQTVWQRIKTVILASPYWNKWTFTVTPIEELRSESHYFSTIHDMLPDMPEHNDDGTVDEPVHFLHQQYRLLWGGQKMKDNQLVNVPPGNNLLIIMQVAFNIGQYNALPHSDIVPGIKRSPVDYHLVMSAEDLAVSFQVPTDVFDDLNEALGNLLE